MTLEPERYELREQPRYRFQMDRRQFLASVGGGLVVVLTLDPARGQESGGGRRRGFGRPMPQDIAAWLHIAQDGAITVYTGKVEIGQNIRTSLAQAVAEELRVPIQSIQMVMGDTDLTPFDMGTFGSMTTPQMAPQLHRVAAAARETLIGLAAAQWKADRAGLAAKDGGVENPATGKSLSYGELTRGRKLMETVGPNPQVAEPAEWKVAGRTVAKVNGVEIVTGQHRYPIDQKLPGMLYGKVVRPEAFGATLEAADTSAAERMKGVVVAREGNFLGVAAPDQATADRAAKAITAKWKTEPQPSWRELFEYLKQNPDGDPQVHEKGSVEAGYAEGAKRLKQTYTVAYIAHTPLEPRAALAEWKDGRVTVWTGTQRPFGVRGELAQAFGLPEEKVHVLMPDMGSGYGGKHTGEAAVEAARLAKAAGKPVKLVWTREEEFTWAYFRPEGVIEVASAVRADGTIAAWEFHNYNSGAAGIHTPYEIANQRTAFHPAKTPLRQGSYRALAATANHFARETHMDELAALAGLDPLEFRLRNAKDERLRAVIEAAARKFGWPGPKGNGRGCGIAAGFEKNDYVATCAEVAVDPATGTPRIVRAVEAFDCGAVVNPGGLENQISGAMVMGIGGALFEQIEFAKGKILNARLSRYRVPRFADAPKIEVVLVDRKDVRSAGAGETPIVGLAPAVGNAIFAATGVRLRSMPLGKAAGSGSAGASSQ